MNPTPSTSCENRCLRAGVLTLALLAAGAAGCSKSTYLVLNFTRAAVQPDILGIRVTLVLSQAGEPDRQSKDTLPSATNAAVIQFPTSAAFKLDDASGALAITAEALDKNRSVVARGSATTTIRHAETWTLPLAFGSAQALLVQSSGQALEPASERGSWSLTDEEMDRDGGARDPTWASP